MLTAAVTAPETPSVAAVVHNAYRNRDGDGARCASTAIGLRTINAIQDLGVGIWDLGEV
jgi:hypothetical protein